MKDPKSPSTFTNAAARRIVRAVRELERGGRDIHAAPLRTAWDDFEPIRIARTTGSWPKGAQQEVDVVYQEDCEDEGESTKLQAWNLLFPVAEDRLVTLALALNGCWYMVGAESCGDDPNGCNCPAIGGQDLAQLPNYDAAKTQFLAHVSGCLRWVNAYVCPEVE